MKLFTDTKSFYQHIGSLCGSDEVAETLRKKYIEAMESTKNEFFGGADLMVVEFVLKENPEEKQLGFCMNLHLKSDEDASDLVRHIFLKCSFEHTKPKVCGVLDEKEILTWGPVPASQQH